jgi:hypothetical protein
VNIEWRCNLCKKTFETQEVLRGHTIAVHENEITTSQVEEVISTSKRRVPCTVATQLCPFCLTAPSKTEAGFARHVGKHQQEIALAALPWLGDTSDDEKMENSESSDNDNDDDDPKTIATEPPIRSALASIELESTTGCQPSPTSSEVLQKPQELRLHLGPTNGKQLIPSRNPLHRADSQSSILSHGHLTTSETMPSELHPTVNTELVNDDTEEDIQSERTLRDDLCDARIELQPFRYFIAVDDLRRLITVDSISAELARCNAEFGNHERGQEIMEKISQVAWKLFAILVYVEQGHRIIDFLDENIDDTDLPFVRSDETSTSVNFKLCSKKKSSQPIKCMLLWNQRLVNDFGRDQWCMLAPIFEYTDEIEHYELDDNCVLPWIERSDRAINEGGYSTVCKVAIHPAHQQTKGFVKPKVKCPVFLNSQLLTIISYRPTSLLSKNSIKRMSIASGQKWRR